MIDRDLGQSLDADIDVVLVGTRKGVTDCIPMSEEYTILPESFRRGYYPHWGRLRNETELFLLTERRFASVDTAFQSIPSKLIEFYIKNSTDQVRVLDLGGGRDGTSARGIADQHPSIEVINIDKVAINDVWKNFTSIRGDICETGLPAASLDVVYSHQVLPYMSTEEHYKKPLRVIDEIDRILKPGGAGVIDWTDEPRIAVDMMDRIREIIDGRVMAKVKSYGGEFLFIVKTPIPEEIPIL
jgi:SAM-dependent methyltransferase